MKRSLLLLVGTALAVLAVAPAANAKLIVGTAGDDTLAGTDRRDLVKGRDGDDVIAGNGAADFLFGQRGDDTVSGDDGPDVIHGGRGADSLEGGEGWDDLTAGWGADSLEGGPGHDVLRAGENDDMPDVLDCGDGPRPGPHPGRRRGRGLRARAHHACAAGTGRLPARDAGRRHVDGLREARLHPRARRERHGLRAGRGGSALRPERRTTRSTGTTAPIDFGAAPGTTTSSAGWGPTGSGPARGRTS